MKRKLLRTHLRLSNLKQYSESSIQFSSATGIDKMTYARYKNIEDDLLKSIRKCILSDTYKFTRYKEKLIIKNRNSNPRCISIPTLKDKLCLKIILETLKEYFPECKRTYLPQECIKIVTQNLNLHKYDYFIKLDIKNFYGIISHTILKDFLKKRIKDKILLNLIFKALENPTYPEKNSNNLGLPQGLSISNILSQIYMLNFDNMFSLREDIFVIRYVDDILIFCNEKYKDDVINELSHHLTNNCKLELNKDKQKHGCLRLSSFDFLGYSIYTSNFLESKLSIKSTNRFRLENKIINIITRYKHSDKKSFTKKALIFELNLIISGSVSSLLSGEIGITRRYGWIFFYSQISDISILYHMDNFVATQLSKILDSASIYEVKKFSKAYFEIKYNLKNSSYIFKPDEYTENEKACLLEKIYNIHITDTEMLHKMFWRLVYRKISENERDLIWGIS